ncbi:hypothetical protein CBF45_04130 [Bordetella sp. J329]|nr:hypothetical protein CBF45_04130 [Bordetella sp. J329]
MKKSIIVGAGLAGPLLAILLKKNGWNVQLIEKRADSRINGTYRGRSINLALARRGINALMAAGMDSEIMSIALPMAGRMVHIKDIQPKLHPYGVGPDEVIWSIHRGRLNEYLLNEVDRLEIPMHFSCQVSSIDFSTSSLKTDGGLSFDYDLLVGADGADSYVRSQLSKSVDLKLTRHLFPHGYKELEIPSVNNSDHAIEPNALHVWPRGDYMCIALPNTEGTFTVTLFMRHSAQSDTEPSFATIETGEQARAFFDLNFPDLSRLLPGLEKDYATNPTGSLSTTTMDSWQGHGNIVLVGDAAHPMVPFHGQGMNCAFEDVLSLFDEINNSPQDISSAICRYENDRKPNAIAIQNMAIENYHEMSARVAHNDYLIERELSEILSVEFPDRFVSRYRMVTFMLMPYDLAYRRGAIQQDILKRHSKYCSHISEVDIEAARKDVQNQLPTIALEYMKKGVGSVQ